MSLDAPNICPICGENVSTYGHRSCDQDYEGAGIDGPDDPHRPIVSPKTFWVIEKGQAEGAGPTPLYWIRGHDDTNGPLSALAYVGVA